MYQAAVELTKQLPTWAQLGKALMHENRVEEAVAALQEGASGPARRLCEDGRARGGGSLR